MLVQRCFITILWMPYLQTVQKDSKNYKILSSKIQTSWMKLNLITSDNYSKLKKNGQVLISQSYLPLEFILFKELKV